MSTYKSTYKKLNEIYNKHMRKYRGNKDSKQVCCMWSTNNPPDIIEGTEPFNDIEATFKIIIDEDEVEDVMIYPGEDRPGREGSRVAIGQTMGGRYLPVIYVPDPEPDSVFVITAYELSGKPLKAYRRRRKGK